MKKNKATVPSSLNSQLSTLNFPMSDIDEIIEHGIVFKGASKGGPKNDDKVKTKAKKKKYITGAHGSGSAKQKAKYRQQRANRASQRKKK